MYIYVCRVEKVILNVAEVELVLPLPEEDTLKNRISNAIINFIFSSLDISG